MKVKKIISLISCVVMAFTSTVAVNRISSSYNGTNTISANATDEIPDGYTPIYTFEDLYAVRNNVYGNYILMNDIDMSKETAPGGDWDVNGTGWEPISVFRGNFNGNGHAIIGLNIHGTTQYSHMGLFGYVDSYVKNNKTYIPVIKNLALLDVNIDIDFGDNRYNKYLGSLGGEVRDCNIVNCYTTGNISFRNSGASCYSYVGGLVGNKCNDGYIYYSYNAINIKSTDSTPATCGGICASGDVVHSYNIGKIDIATKDKYAITNDYDYYYRCVSCYYLNGSCEGQESVSGTCMGLSIGQMKSEAAFTNWDFDKIWFIDPTSSYKYPQLRAVMQVPITQVELLYKPDKTTYVQGEKIDLQGAYIGVTHSDGSYGEAAVKEKFISKYDMNKIGKQTIVINYGGKTASFDINIKPKNITGLRTDSTSTDEINLSWNKIDDVTGYIIYVPDNQGSWEEYSRTYTNTNSAVVDCLDSGTSYTFAVKAYKETDDEDILSDSYVTIKTSTNPEKVGGFKSSSITSNSMKLYWNKVNGASGYYIYQFNDKKQIWEKVTKTSATSYSIKSLSSGKTYMFYVKAVRNVNGKEFLSVSYPTLKSTTLPAGVTGLKCSTVSTKYVKLSWYKSSGAKGYVVYQLKGSKWSKIKTTASTSYTVSGLKAGTNYKFCVKPYTNAANKTIYGTTSKALTLSTKSAAVNTKLTSTKNKVTIKWGKVTGATDYKIYYKTSKNGKWKLIKNASYKTTSYTKSGLSSGKYYWFRVDTIRKANGKTLTTAGYTKSIKTKIVSLAKYSGTYKLKDGGDIHTLKVKIDKNNYCKWTYSLLLPMHYVSMSGKGYIVNNKLTFKNVIDDYGYYNSGYLQFSKNSVKLKNGSISYTLRKK